MSKRQSYVKIILSLIVYQIRSKTCISWICFYLLRDVLWIRLQKWLWLKSCSWVAKKSFYYIRWLKRLSSWNGDELGNCTLFLSSFYYFSTSSYVAMHWVIIMARMGKTRIIPINSILCMDIFLKVLLPQTYGGKNIKWSLAEKEPYDTYF